MRGYLSFPFSPNPLSYQVVAFFWYRKTHKSLVFAGNLFFHSLFHITLHDNTFLYLTIKDHTYTYKYMKILISFTLKKAFTDEIKMMECC